MPNHILTKADAADVIDGSEQEVTIEFADEGDDDDDEGEETETEQPGQQRAAANTNTRTSTLSALSLEPY